MVHTDKGFDDIQIQTDLLVFVELIKLLDYFFDASFEAKIF